MTPEVLTDEHGNRYRVNEELSDTLSKFGVRGWVVLPEEGEA